MLFKKSLYYFLIITSLFSLSGNLSDFEDNIYTDYTEPNFDPPGGLNKEEVPMFVSIGFDDNYDIEGLTWIADYTKGLNNPKGKGNSRVYDGDSISLTFFNTGLYSDKCSKIWKRIYDEGHEIGNHSFSHPHGFNIDWSRSEYKILLNRGKWNNEFVKTEMALAEIGVEADSLFGGRIPFLEYSDESISQLYKLKYKYDCSIEEGFQPTMTPGNYFWPYTLDNGSPGSRVASSWVNNRKPIGDYPGLWELPVYALVIPPDSMSVKYGFDAGLRNKVGRLKPYVELSEWKITGFDYNLLYSDSGGELLSNTEFLATLKYNLDLRLEGNRAPFMLGAHINYYNCENRRDVIESFLEYALTKESVRIVSYNKILDWIRSPSAL